MKRYALLLPLILMVGCASGRVPQTAINTPFGKFDVPKDMDIEIEDLKFTRDTNGVIFLTAKSIRSKSRNNPKAISASAAQDQANWDGFKSVAGEITERSVKAALSKP